jgi:hypothetical protein
VIELELRQPADDEIRVDKTTAVAINADQQATLGGLPPFWLWGIGKFAFA